MKHRALILLAATAAFAQLCASPAIAGSRALLIGVGTYQLPNNDLPGIDLDIDNMKHVAQIMGFGAAETKVLFNDEATYAGVRQALTGWLREGVGPNDRVLIYFSGHGTRVPDPRPDHSGASDDALLLHDVRRATVAGHPSLGNVLLGYEFGAALAAIPSQHVLVLVDACHSGTATRTLALGNQRLGETSGAIKFLNYPGAPTGVTRALRADSGAENYAALSAARDDEFAIATQHGGLFTLAVLDGIDQASRDAKNLTVEQLQSSTSLYIEQHTSEQSRHHPMTDGNQRLIKGQLELIPLRNGNGPTWSSLESLSKQGDSLAVSTRASEVAVGDQMVLTVDVPRPGFLNVVTVDGQDRTTVLYPNEFSPTNEVAAGKFQFPTPSMNFDLLASEPVGPTLVVAFLSDKKINLLELGVEGRDAAGKMQQTFTEVTALATRAIRVEARQHQGFAAGSMTVTVKPKASS
jgi:hypothetical protein